MLESITQSLAGRAAILKLLPFNTKELAATEFKDMTTNKLIFNGFYPRLFDKKIEPDDYYPNYIQTYLERDVKTLKNINDLNVFTRFLKLCASRIGSILNYWKKLNPEFENAKSCVVYGGALTLQTQDGALVRFSDLIANLY